MSRIDLRAKPILITGASSGIGMATALACAQADMPVVLCARREDRLDELASRIISKGGRALAFPLDVRDPERCQHAVDACVETYGSIYCVFANAGYGYEQPIHTTPPEKLRDIFEVNLFGSINIINPALPHLIEAQQGHILLCSSCLSHMPVPRYAAYSATKAAQYHLGRAMRLELAADKVHVTTVHPTGTATEFFDTARAKSPGGVTVLDPGPKSRMHSPERVAKVVMRTLRSPQPEVWTSLSVKTTFKLAALMPRTTDRLMQMMVTKRLRSRQKN